MGTPQTLSPEEMAKLSLNDLMSRANTLAGQVATLQQAVEVGDLGAIMEGVAEVDEFRIALDAWAGPGPRRAPRGEAWGMAG